MHLCLKSNTSPEINYALPKSLCKGARPPRPYISLQRCLLEITVFAEQELAIARLLLLHLQPLLCKPAISRQVLSRGVQ
jgi:hypothetical protein